MNYNYYRGLLFTGLEMYEEAKHCLQLVLDTPYPMLHILQVQAFKKIVLLTWLTSRHNPNDNEHKSVRVAIRSILNSKGMTGKHLENICGNYSKAENINKFFILSNSDELQKDINIGLTLQVIRKLRNEVLESLTQTYNMLDIQEIDKRLTAHRDFFDLKEEQEKQEVLKKLKDKVMEDMGYDDGYQDDDVHTVLITMIKKGHISGKIDMTKNIVVFDDEESDITDLVKTIESQSQEIIEIVGKIEQADRDIIMEKKAGVNSEEELGADSVYTDSWMDDMQ